MKAVQSSVGLPEAVVPLSKSACISLRDLEGVAVDAMQAEQPGMALQGSSSSFSLVEL